MLERIADGLLGLFMFFSNWFSPGSDYQKIEITAATQLSQGYRLECAMKLEWNEQLSDLIDAGIPLRFQIKSSSDIGDSVTFLRTLECDLRDYTYLYKDTLLVPLRDSVFISQKYTQIYRALRHYSRWTCIFSQRATHIDIEAELLPSKVSQFNRSIDISHLFGCRKYTFNLTKTK